MEVEQAKLEKKSSIFKKLEKYLSFKRQAESSSSSSSRKPIALFTKSRTWHNSATKGEVVAPSGCFSVYVGPEKQRFLIKTEFANHPLFKMLLEEAELEYGFKTEGPLLLPCEVDHFWKVLAEMDNSPGDEEDRYNNNGFGCGSCSPFSSGRRSTSYALLTPPRVSSRLITSNLGAR